MAKKIKHPITGRKTTVNALKKRAWKSFSRYIRERDKICVICGGSPDHAGHYFHNGDKQSNSLKGNELWYDEKNIHACCVSCNLRKHGNLHLYAIRLIDMYGSRVLHKLEKKFNTPKEWTVESLIKIEDKYNKKYICQRNIAH